MADEAVLVWFRQDLRLNDNPALYQAAKQGRILPVYILPAAQQDGWFPGAASRWWLHHSLDSLGKRLGGALRLFQGEALELIPELLHQTGIKKVYWNRDFQPAQMQRDRRLQQHLEQQGIQVTTFNASLLWEPTQVLKSDGSPYRVYTPFFRHGCLKQPEPRYPLPAPPSIKTMSSAPNGLSLQQLELLPDSPWYRQIARQWQPGEPGAGDRLASFVEQRLASYQRGRDHPGLDATSRLSPHLHFGELSPNQIWYVARHAELPRACEPDRERFMAELGWREFSHYLLYHWPELPQSNFQPKFDRFDWSDDPESLRAWQQGRTGIPMVDAGMRELWQTGYMHNRVRMIVGSFLVKNLRQHWHRGQAWFWDTLVDADLANNSASWQWVAGSGADAAPYFRIFNPVTQGEKFDPKGGYVRRFCPELAALPDKYLHSPWQAPVSVLKKSGVQLGTNYPRPMVDLKLSRAEALAAFAAIKQ
ncbi:deoxyribodipyrimidine photo-lyase [Motiliproteus coralliicola]|uniref:Deoxyribodipyrimidine photo-lyase n=1 Tax=Motiliproteus coralliicola TaxID=2283196 RepID=A0A369WFS0_9GAMM|nr:deoxyribodipyrimidine photo-lyase [Motiliproteus coralliicola]RDE19514.1 deoxyribodipyrimidine photo-lyase [Motiliproteus coralliicola]